MKKNLGNGDRVTITIGEIILPTYALTGENRNPVFHSQYGVAHIYPYTLQDEIAPEPAKKTYRTLVLENKYLLVTVLPDLGGRVYSLLDKISGQEVFYKNPTIKFSPLAIRGAFFSGGLEFSFPVAHAPTTADPVNWDIRQEDDGSASIMIGGTEHMSGMRWTIKLTLFPNRCALAQDVFLYNPTPIPGRYHYWTNASLVSDEKTEFIYPLRRARSYEFAGTASWPVARLDLITGEPGLPGMEGVPMWPADRLHKPLNLRWEKDMLAQVSVFGRDVRWNYFGAWQHSTNTGYAHYARHQDVSGMKLWSWGKTEVGVVNQSALMDDGSTYAETQCGAMETQLDFDFLAPGRTKTWREWWLPLRKLGGLTCASETVGARLRMAPGKSKSSIELDLGICPAYPLENAALELSIPGKVLHSEGKLNASPEAPWLKTVSVEARVLGAHPITLRVTDPEGQEILNYTHSRETDPVPCPEKIEEKIPLTAEDYYQQGLDHENFDNRQLAIESYQQALDHDRNHCLTHYQLGLTLLRNADYAGAQDHLKQVTGKKSGGAGYFLGMISWYLGEPEKAQGKFQSVPSDNAFAFPALRGQVSAALLAKNWQEAIQLLNEIEPANEYQNLHSLLLAIANRNSGNLKSAAQTLMDLITLDPLNLTALREFSLIQNDSQNENALTLERLLADDPQYILDLAGFYLDCGLFLDALVVLEDLGSEWDYPIKAYLAGYICQLVGQEENAKSWRKKAQVGEPDKVFPSRLWEINALISALDKQPDDYKAKYYLGNFYYAHQRYEEAVELWEQALAGLGNYDILHRNLGLAYWQQKDDLLGAAEELERALALNPNNQDLYILLDDLYCTQNRNDKREKLLEVIQKLNPLREDLRKRTITIMSDLGRFEEVLEILGNETFVPLEMDQSFHALYVRTLIQQAEALGQEGNLDQAIAGLQLALEYPENHGVGRPTTLECAGIHYRLGCLYEQIGRYEEALKSWKLASCEHHPVGDPLFEFVQKSLDKIGRYSEIGFEVSS